MKSCCSRRLVHRAERVRNFEKKAEADATSGSVIRAWLLGPLRIAIGELVRFWLTLAAVLVMPRTFHSIPVGSKNPFLGARAFVIGAIGFYELLGGQFVNFNELDQIANPLLKLATKTAASATALIVLVSIVAFTLKISARVAAVDLDLANSYRLAGYSMGTIPVLQLLIVVPIVVTLPAPGNAVSFFSAFLVVLGGVFWLIHATFVVPMRLKHPFISLPRLWFGWWIGWSIGMAMLLSLVALMTYLLPVHGFSFGFR